MADSSVYFGYPVVNAAVHVYNRGLLKSLFFIVKETIKITPTISASHFLLTNYINTYFWLLKYHFLCYIYNLGIKMSTFCFEKMKIHKTNVYCFNANH